MSTFNLTNLQNAQWHYDSWRKSLSTKQLIAFSLLIATLTGLMAQIKIYLPLTPVPITLQTFMVLVSGVILGKNWGAVSQVLYIALGAAGIPWFANGNAGLAYILGPTAGYLLGFIVTAYVMGWIYDRVIISHDWLPLLGLMILCNLFCIYGFGLLYLAVWSNLIQGNQHNVSQILWMGFFPFLIGDVLKIIVASFLATTLSSKKKSL